AAMTVLDGTAPRHPRLPLRPLRPTAADWSAPGDVDRLERRSLVAGGVGAALSLVGLFVNRPVFFRAYLISWTFCVGITLGCLAISMLHHLSRGAWGLPVRRGLEAAARTLPLLLLLSLPILFGMKEISPWARPEVVAGDPILEAKHAYLNVQFFIVRLVVYFLVWGGFATLLDRLSRRQDETGDPRLARRMQLLAGPGLAIYCLAATFAAVDWLMSLQPHWV